MNSGHDVFSKILENAGDCLLTNSQLMKEAHKDIIDLRTAIGLLTYLTPEDTDTQFAVDILTVVDSIIERTNHCAT